MRITNIDAFSILDSRGNPTLKVKVLLDDGSLGSFEVPSGASTGVHEALELRDCDKSLFGGKSVYKAIDNVLKIRDELIGFDFTQESFDNKLLELDGTENKSVLGANAILGLSCAFARACALYYELPLYEYLHRLVNKIDFLRKKDFSMHNVHLFANVINGGMHSGNLLKIQEFMIVPVFDDVNRRIRAISEIYQMLKTLIEEKYGKNSTAVGDEGGFAPDISKAESALDLLVDAINKSNYKDQVYLAMDAAASDFYNNETLKYEVEQDMFLDYKELSDYYNKLVQKYPIISIEDPFAEDDFEGFAYYMKNKAKLNIKNPLNDEKKELLIVGDDLLVTNPKRIKTAIDKKMCNSLLLKINQIGTLTESIKAYDMAVSKKWHVIVSHRSGETTDSFISDLCVAMQSSIKIGAPCRGERTAKYNRLLEIYRK